MQYGGLALEVEPLSMDKHIICVSIGLGSLVWGFIVRLIPDKLFVCIKLDEEEIKGSKRTLLSSVRRTPPSTQNIEGYGKIAAPKGSSKSGSNRVTST